MKYVIAMFVGGAMVSVSFIGGAIAMYAVMTGPYPKDHAIEATESEG